MLCRALILGLITLMTGIVSQAQEREELSVMSAGDTLRRNWSLTLFNIVSQENMTYNRSATSDRSQSTYTYLSMNYKINSDHKFSLRVPFTYETAGQNRYGDQIEGELNLQDIHASLAFYDLGYIGDVDVSGNFKVYLPTGEYSQNSGMITKIRFETFFEYALGNFSYISYGIKPDIYWQSRTASFNSDTKKRADGSFVTDPRSTNKIAEVEQFLEINADINKYVSFKPRIGLDESWYHSSEIEGIDGRHVTKAFYQIAFNLRPVRGVSFLVGMSNDTILKSNRGKDIAFGQPENNQYFVMTNAFLF